MERNSPHDNEHEPDIELQASESTCPRLPAEPRAPVIYFAEDVLAQMRRHAHSDTSTEVAGVLVGEVHCERNNVIVHACIPAQFTEASRGNVTFTHESWAQINSVMDSEYRDYSIVGWYHSHPDFGVFLSSYDTFIHRNFFNAHWQIAYVLDPVRGDEGCFAWEADQLVQVPNMKLYMDVEVHRQAQSEAAGEQDLPGAFTAAAEGRMGRQRLETGEKWALGLLAALIAMTLMLQVYGVGELLRLRAELRESRGELSALSLRLTEALASAAATEPDLAAPATPAPEVGAGAEPTETLTADIYQVMRGDTLAGISRQFYDTPDYAVVIAAINGTRQDAQLEVGTTLLIPRLPETQAQPDPTPEP